MNKNFLKCFLLLAFVFFGSEHVFAAATNTVQYKNNVYKVSFTHNGDYLNFTETNIKRKNDFVDKFCPDRQIVKCKSNKDKIIEQLKKSNDPEVSSIREQCGTDADCLASVNHLITQVFEHYIEGKPFADDMPLSNKAKAVGEKTFRNLNGPDNFSYETDSIKRAIVTKDNFYKKNKQSVTFYWTNNNVLCGFLKNRDVCFSGRVDGSKLTPIFQVERLDTPEEDKKLENLIKDQYIKIFTPVIDTFKFI